MTKREKELFELLNAYATCVSLVVAWTEKRPLGNAPRGRRMRTLLTDAVAQWIEEHPEKGAQFHEELRRIHESVLKTEDR